MSLVRSSFAHACAIFMAALCLIQSKGVSAAVLSWTQREGFREAALPVPPTGRARFTLLRPEETGVLFTNQLSYERAEANQNLMNGCGVAAGDFDGDGHCDLYFPSADGPAGLFRNLGNGRFENVAAAAGVEATSQSTKGVVFADVNGDGRLDLFCAALGGPNALLLNLGDGRFSNVTTAAGLAARAGAHSTALADIDGDGDLDLYVANYGEVSILRNGGQVTVRNVNGQPTVTGRHARRLRIINGAYVEYGEPDALYLNDGKGNFSAVSWTDGRFLTAEGQPLKSELWDMGLSVLFRDINGDTHPDIYVCNDFQTPDRIWINDGAGRFRALPDLALRVTPHFSMGVDFADIDRDGDDDFFVGDMLSRRHALRMTQLGASNPPPSHVGETMDRVQERRNVLALNRGDGTYSDIAWFAGVAASDWTWSVAFLDVDLDGYEDLLAVNAHGRDTQDLDMMERAPDAHGTGMNRQIGKALKNFPPLITPNFAFRNGQNRTFSETGAKWGFDSTNISHGIALADLDNDGDLDVAVSCLWAPPLIYRNESSAPRVAVRLRGLSPNTRGIGAKVKLLGTVPEQSQEVHAGGRYLSADDTMRVFAANTGASMTLEVIWRSGKRSVVRGVKANHIYEIDEAAAQSTPANPQSAIPNPQFVDASAALNHSHERTWFNDLERQPMLIRMLSQLGPGVACHDLNGDGHDDLVIGSSLGGRIGVARGDGKGGFTMWTNGAWGNPLAADGSGFAAWGGSLLAGVSGYRGGAPPGLETITSAGRVAVPGIVGEASVGPVAVADVDGDSDLDVFVGGRVIPGRYPEAASSLLFRNDGGRLAFDAARSETLKKVGLVSGAVFSDLDGDGLPELVLACEWGPVRVFRAEGNGLREMTAELGLADEMGWWNGVTTGDLDGDGQMDIIAGNWGLNNSYAERARIPARVFFGDLDKNGTMDLIEAELDPERGLEVPKRDLLFLSLGMPVLRTRFATHRAFSVTAMQAVAPEALRHQATVLASVVFMNRGGRFKIQPLPDEAQWSPAFGVNVADFDGDGNEDVFLSQNFFAHRPEEARLDAGRGLLLRGDGKGGFAAVAARDSGILIHGEQRGSATGDFNEDGRVDLVVAQNGGATKVYRNASARPGLRVRLQGPAGNPQGVGAVLRLKFGGKFGPARELHGGSGYWSQDSLVAVLATPQPPTALWVRWPGGKVTEAPVPADAVEVRVNVEGMAKKLR